MLLKRHYAIPPGWEPQYNTRDTRGRLPDPHKAEDVLLNPLPIDALSIIHSGVAQAQHFSRHLVDAGVAEGWLTLGRGKILLHTREGDLEYTIVQMPGRYCLYCDWYVAVDPAGSAARTHIADQHAGLASPNPQWPHGYRVVDGYHCLLDADQHAKWQRPAYATVSHARYKA